MNHTNDSGESIEQANQPRLCTNGCGFFANPATMNLCSKCYRDTVSEKERSLSNEKAAAQALNVAAQAPALPTTSQALLASTPAHSTPAIAPASSAAQPEVESAPAAAAAAPSTSGAGAGDGPSDDRPVQKNHSRCFSCKKKIGLTGFKCRCGYTFCGTHRYAEAHTCDFDYKAMGRQSLAQQNPLVMASKLDKL